MSATAQRREPRVPLVAAPEPAAGGSIPAATLQLDAAVLRVQAAAAKLVRNATGQIQSRTYGYVTLTAVMDEVLPLLVAEDLVWKTFPTSLESGNPGLRYTMTHLPSGEMDEDRMPLPCDPTMQALGSGITYGRRYALQAYLGLTVDEDDDGASANQPVRTVGDGVPTSQERSQPTAQRKESGGDAPTPMSAKQRGLIRGRAKDAGLSTQQFADAIRAGCGQDPEPFDDEDRAKGWINRQLQRLPWTRVDPILHAIATGEKAS